MRRPSAAMRRLGVTRWACRNAPGGRPDRHAPKVSPPPVTGSGSPQGFGAISPELMVSRAQRVLPCKIEAPLRSGQALRAGSRQELTFNPPDRRARGKRIDADHAFRPMRPPHEPPQRRAINAASAGCSTGHSAEVHHAVRSALAIPQHRSLGRCAARGARRARRVCGGERGDGEPNSPPAPAVIPSLEPTRGIHHFRSRTKSASTGSSAFLLQMAPAAVVKCGRQVQCDVAPVNQSLRGIKVPRRLPGTAPETWRPNGGPAVRPCRPC